MDGFDIPTTSLWEQYRPKAYMYNIYAVFLPENAINETPKPGLFYLPFCLQVTLYHSFSLCVDGASGLLWF